MTNQLTKSSLRAQQKQLRATLPDVSSQVCSHLQGWLEGQNPKTVLGYKAFAGEISLESLTNPLPKIQFLTTRISSKTELTLHPFASATQINRFGILEPPEDAPVFAPAVVDVVLVPGLGFTSGGGRLGYGGGFYDRLLPQFRSDCLLVGVIHSALLLPEIPLEQHDVKMQFLALETGVLPTQPMLWLGK